MREQDAMLGASIRNSGLSTLLCSTLGFALVEAWIIRLGAGPVTHVIVVLIGALLGTVAHRAVHRFHTAVIGGDSFILPDSGLFKLVNLGCAVLLIAFGYAGAAALSNGPLILFVAFAACAFLFPWSKIALCRTHILVPLALITVPMFCGVLATDRLPHPLFLPAAIWLFCVGAAGAWLRNIFYRHRKLKASGPVLQQRVDE